MDAAAAGSNPVFFSLFTRCLHLCNTVVAIIMAFSKVIYQINIDLFSEQWAWKIELIDHTFVHYYSSSSNQFYAFVLKETDCSHFILANFPQFIECAFHEIIGI